MCYLLQTAKLTKICHFLHKSCQLFLLRHCMVGGKNKENSDYAVENLKIIRNLRQNRQKFKLTTNHNSCADASNTI